ncbi:hypothetical protein [Roseateles sp. P5_D6]
MVAAVNTQAPASPLTSGASAGRTEQPAKELDSGNLQDVVVKISTEGAKRAGTATQAAQAAPSAQGLPARPDDGGDVQVTAQQLQASAPKAPPADASGGGAAPAGGETPAVSTSTSQTYEPADTDEDGTVSPMERQAYEAKLADEKAAAQAEKSARAAEADAAVRAYEAVEQLGGAEG